MAIGLSWEEAGLGMGYNKSVNALQRQAQAIIDDKDAHIVRLQRELAVMRAENADLRAQVEGHNLDHNFSLLQSRIDRDVELDRH